MAKTKAKGATKGGTAAKAPKSMPKGGKDPKGGLTAKGREFFKESEGLNLRPGVKGKADTPEKMVRKGSFLRRHFANPQGPVKDKDGNPTRQALEAAAWGEAVPKSTADEKKLADKGAKLLEQYHAIKGDKKAGAPSKGKKARTGAGGAKRATAKKAGSTRSAGSAKRATKSSSAGKAAAKTSPPAKKATGTKKAEGSRGARKGTR